MIQLLFEKLTLPPEKSGGRACLYRFKFYAVGRAATFNSTFLIYPVAVVLLLS